MKYAVQIIRTYFVYTLLLGALYPLLVTLFGFMAFNDKANGSLVFQGDRVLGSKLIGQNFVSDKYFHGRPSASNYDATSSGGTNLGPLSASLRERVQNTRLALGLEAPASPSLLFTSASGLDPEIDWQSVELQLPRIIKARWPKAELLIQEKLLVRLSSEIKSQRVADRLSLFEIERYNVLELNIWLDQLKI